MADNVTFQTTAATPADGTIVAAREVSAGGDTAQVQVMVPVGVTGSEGAYTLREFVIADDAAFTPGTSAVAMVGAEYDDTGPDSVDEGDGGALRMSARRELYTQIRDAAGNERGANVNASGQLAVAGPVTNAGTFVVQINGDALTALQNADTDLTTIIGHVDGLEGLLTTIDGDTGSILTAVQLIDDTVYVDDADWSDGTSKHLLVGGLYQSAPQTVTDGDVAPFNITANGALHVAVQNTLTVASHAVTNAGTFAVQVDGDALTALQLIDNIVKLEDDAHQSGDAGVMLLAVRQSAQADFGADGDYVPLSIDDDGQLRVNAGTVTASADSEYVDDADWTDGTSVHTLVGGLYQATPQTVTDGDVAPFNITANGALHVAVQSSALPSGAATAANQSTIIGHVDGIETLIGTTNTHLSNIQQTDGASGIAGGFQVVPAGYWFDDDTPSAMTEGDLGGARMSSRREIYMQIRDAAGNERGVNVNASNQLAVTGPVTNAGTFAVQVDGSALTALQLIDDVIYVDDADWTDSTSKHALVGGLYQSSPQTVTDGDVAPFNITVNGALHTSLVTALPAGTNGIGKLTANSGVDIGDVDVTSIVLPRNLIGPGQPGTAVDSYTHAAFNLAAGANQVLVSSAPSKQIWVYGIGFSVNVAGTVSFQDEDDTAITGVMQIGATGGMVVAPSGNFSMPIWKLGTDKDLEVDVVTSELDGWIDYAIISV